MTAQLVTLERGTKPADVLIVACTAATPERPHYGIFTRRQIESLRRIGIRCDVLAIAGFVSPLAYAKASLMLAGPRFRKDAYALIHAHGGEAALATTPYRRAPLMISFQGSDLLGSPGADGRLSLGWRMRSRLARSRARTAAAVIVKAAVMQDALPEDVRDRVEVIPNGVDRARFKPIDRQESRHILGWKPDELVVLYASDPSRPSKRPDLARKVCEVAARQLGPVRMHTAHGVAPDLMPHLMNASDCLLHPSASEGSPNVVKEALACNLPVVATPVGDIPELLAGIDNCHVCPPEADALAAALTDCLMPPKRSNGRVHTAWLGEDEIARKVADVYERVAGRRLRG